MKLVIVTPHFAPDIAPTGVVITRITEELAARGHRIEVITSLPWYRDHRIEPGWEGMLRRHEDTPWGRIVRIHPFPASDKTALVRRALAFGAFSVLGGVFGARGGPVDGVLAVSPPLTLGLTGLTIARARHAAAVFNVQDVYPDVAIELGALKGSRVIKATRALERYVYQRSDAVTVLSDDLKDNVAAKLGDDAKVHVIPNFVDIERIRPSDPDNPYRREYGLEGKTVVMYAGNVGLSQSLDVVLDAAAALATEEVVFVINGGGAARAALQRRAKGMSNVVFVDAQPEQRLPEVLAAADIHLVPLKAGLARSSVPSKTYSILAAGRPLVASVDHGSEIARIVEGAGAGIAVPPEDAESLTKAIRALVEEPERRLDMGAAGRRWVEAWASPAAIAESYEKLFLSLRDKRRE